MSEDDWIRLLESTHEAVRDFGRNEFAALARKAIHRLQRIPASAIFGDDYIYKTLWDEYCHEVQQGPHELLEYAWEQSLETVLDAVVECVPGHSAVLLSIFAAWDLGEQDDPALIGAVWPDGIKRVLHEKVSEHAAKRCLNHLSPYRDM